MLIADFLKAAPNTPLLEALSLMNRGSTDPSSSTRDSILAQPISGRSSYILVMDGEKLVGILTERDAVRLAAQELDLTNLTIAQVMTQQLITLQESDLTDLPQVLSIFRQHRIRHLPVMSEQAQVIGVVTSSSIRSALRSTDLLRLRRVEEVMSTQVVAAPPEASVLHLARLMAVLRVSCVVIAQSDGTPSESDVLPVGIVTESDIVQFETLGLDLNRLTAAHVMSTPLVCLKPQDDLWETHQIMGRMHVRRLVVTDDQGLLAGIVTQTNILSAIDPVEMQNTIVVLRQQIEQLQDERLELMKTRASQLEGQVQKAEQRFQAIFDQTFQFIGLLEPDGTLIEVNQTTLDFGGVQREEVINRPFWEAHWWMISPETQAQLKQAIARAARGKFVRYEVDVLGVDRIITIDFSLRPITNDAGHVKLIIPEGRDISDRKRAEAALLKSEQRCANLAEAAPVGIFQADVAGNYTYVNSRWCGIVGRTVHEVLSINWIDVIHPDDQESVIAEWLFTVQTQQPFRLEYRLQTCNDTDTWVFGQIIPEIEANGQITGYIGTITNITEQKQAELALASLNQELESRVTQRTAELAFSRERYRLLYKKTPIMLHSIDRKGRIRHVSDYWLQKLGYTQKEVIGHKSTEFLTPASRHFAETEILPEYFQTGFCSDIPYQLVAKNGEVIDVLLSASSQQDESDQPISLAVMVDVTARNRAEQALFREKELAQVTLHSIADAVITTDNRGRVEYFNPVAEQLTGWTATEAKGKALPEVFHIVHEVTGEPVSNPVEHVVQTGLVTELANHTVLISRDGAEYSIEDSAAPIRDRQGHMIGAVMVFHDVTQSRQLEGQLSWQANHDALTGLPNRRKFEQELIELLQSVQEEDQFHVLCYMDLDQFKVVNDTCGHTAGDELLRQISRLLKSQVRAADTLARLGGDEFGILLRQCSVEDAEILMEKVRQAVQNFCFIWQGRTFRIGVSIGLASLAIDGSVVTVLSAADAACYAAKGHGRNRIHVYQTHDSELTKQRGERQWSVRIRHALEENRFCLYRQAIAGTDDPETSAPIHYEILLRMVDEQGKLISPGLFIPAAERYDLMLSVDRWVVQTFFAHIEHQHKQQSDSVSNGAALNFINLSGASVSDVRFLDFLQAQFERYAVLPNMIGFEITETAAIANLDRANHFIRELRGLGCQFALDDFGSGMSSFGYLKNLPVDYLKIDGNFIKEITADSSTYAIVEAINHVGHVMNLKTIAEFVENHVIRDELSEIGVDYVQGYGVARPYPIALDNI